MHTPKTFRNRKINTGVDQNIFNSSTFCNREKTSRIRQNIQSTFVPKADKIGKFCESAL